MCIILQSIAQSTLTNNVVQENSNVQSSFSGPSAPQPQIQESQQQPAQSFTEGNTLKLAMKQ